MKKESRNPEKKIWCADCIDKEQPVIKKADFLIPVRKHHYDLSADGFSIDRRVIGICNECLKEKNTFQKSNTQRVHFNNEHIVQRDYKEIILNKRA